jgi:DNA mismatch repair protein MutS
MRQAREHIARAGKLHYKEQKQGWLLDAVDTYCEAVTTLANDLARAELKSRGLLGFRDYLTSYQASLRFTSLLSETKKLKTELGAVDYCILVKGNSFTVRHTEAEADYSADVESTFAKFRQGDVEDYSVKFPAGHDMNHVEAKILEFVARLNPELFSALDDFCATRENFTDETVISFDREIQFYIAYLDYAAVLKRAGLRFCYPQISDKSKDVFDENGFDIALAQKRASEKLAVVCNDFFLKGDERILVVSGPNQGGKTTFARSFGQLHYLASIGCPVPGSAARLFLFDQLLTHFEKEERVENLRGKLEDDLIRIREMLSRATPQSIVIMNEIFTSTTIQDETFLSKKIMQRMVALDLLCVWVTFVDELASFSTQTVSMVSTVVPENPTLRTFKIVRRPADGLAYAMAIAEKYRLTRDAIEKRITS